MSLLWTLDNNTKDFRIETLIDRDEGMQKNF